MSAARWLVTGAIVAWAVSGCLASDKGKPPDIALTLKGPEGELVLGKPILLRVIFQNNLKRDVRIEGFDPENGRYRTGCMVCADGPRTGSVTSRIVTATTKIGIERLSGEPGEDDVSGEMVPSTPQSFLLKAGASQEHTFDLMQTLDGKYTIDSPGRFKVSLVFNVHGVASKDYRHDRLEWEGETHATPIEIRVTGRSSARAEVIKSR